MTESTDAAALTFQAEHYLGQQVFNAAPVIVLLLDLQGMIQSVNPFFEQLTGWRLDEIKGKNWFSAFLPTRDQARIRALFLDATRGFPTRGNINPIITRSGEEREIEWNDQVLRDADGHITSLLSVGIDVTQRRRSEMALQEERDRLRQILDAQFGFICILTLDAVIIEINQTPLTLMGLSRGDVLGRRFCEVGWLEPGTEPQLRAAILAAARGESMRFDILARFPGHGQRVVDATFSPMRDPAGRVINIIGFGIDVTERKHSEEALRLSEARLNEAQRIAGIGSWELDLTTLKLVWSDEIFRLFEIDRAQFGASYEAFLNAVHPEDRDMVNVAYTNSVETRRPYNIVHRLLMADGRIKFVRESCETAYDPTGRPLRSAGTVQDVTERMMADAALRESEERFSKAFHHNQVAMGIRRLRDDVIIETNHRYDRMMKRSKKELIGKKVGEIGLYANPEQRAEVLACADRAEPIQGMEVELRDASGSTFDVLMAVDYITIGGEACSLASFIDITDRKRMEARLNEAHRLANLGAWELDLVSQESWWSEEQYRLNGVEPGTPITQAFFLSLIHPDDRASFDEAFERLLSQGSVETDYRIVCPNGTVRMMHGIASVVRDAAGNPLRLWGTNLDITARRLIEKQVRDLRTHWPTRVAWVP